MLAILNENPFSLYEKYTSLELYKDIHGHSSLLTMYTKYDEPKLYNAVITNEGIVDIIKQILNTFLTWLNNIRKAIINFFKSTFLSSDKKIKTIKENIVTIRKEQKELNLNKLVIPNAVSYETLLDYTHAVKTCLVAVYHKDLLYHAKMFHRVFAFDENNKPSSKVVDPNLVSTWDHPMDALEGFPYNKLIDKTFTTGRIKDSLATLGLKLYLAKEVSNKQDTKFQEFYEVYPDVSSRGVYDVEDLRQSLFENKNDKTLAELNYTIPRLQDLMIIFEKEIKNWIKSTTEVQKFVEEVYERTYLAMRQLNADNKLKKYLNSTASHKHWFTSLIPFQQDCSTYLKLTTKILMRAHEILNMLEYMSKHLIDTEG